MLPRNAHGLECPDCAINMRNDEFLSSDEVATLTGRAYKSAQVEWLLHHGWKFELNAANAPVVGRWYARYRFAGLNMDDDNFGQEPDFSKVV